MSKYRRKKLHFEVVRIEESDKDATIEVRTQIQKNGHWYTAADCYGIPSSNGLDAWECAQFIADKLNEREEALASAT